MDSPKQAIKEFLRWIRPQQAEVAEQTEEQIKQKNLEQEKEILELAVFFDRLTNEPGWEKALLYMAKDVNNQLYEATNKKYEREIRLMLCDMWQAKRELLDGLQGYIDSILKSRDDILGQVKAQSEKSYQQ
jgi:hypothetical protein